MKKTQKEELTEKLYLLKKYVLELKNTGQELNLDNWPKIKECTKKKYKGTFQVSFYLKGNSTPKEKVGLTLTEAGHLYYCLLDLLTDSENPVLTQSELEYGEIEDSQKLINDLYFEYLNDDIEHGKIKPATITAYRDMWKLYLAPFYKGVRVCDLSTALISELRTHIDGLKRNASWIDEKTKKNKPITEETLSQRRKGEIWRLNKNLITRLFLDGMIKEDFTRGFKGFPYRKPAITDGYWNEKTFNSVIEFITDKHLKIFYMICFFCGLRRGEALALRFSDIDWDKKSIRVSRTYNVSLKEIGSPKTGQSRTVYMPDVLYKALIKHKNDSYFRIKHYGEQSLICSRNDGENLFLSATTIQRKLDEASKEANIERIKVHTLRKSYVTNALNLGGNLEAVSKSVGHIDPTITMDVYLRSNDDDMKRIAELMGNKE